jgi:hypothetical protein
MSRKLVFVVCLAALLFVVFVVPAWAATVAPNTWARKFCSTLDSFEQKLNRDGAAADAALSSQATDLKAAKSQLVSFMNKSVANAKHAVQELQRAGTPKIPNGNKIATTFVNALKSAQSLYASAATTAGSLSTSNLAKFETTAQKITASLRKGGERLSGTFRNEPTIDAGGAFRRVLQATPACAFLKGTTSTTTTG